MEDFKISVLEVNLNEIRKNIKYYKNLLKQNQKFCFVAKANCYGFGFKLCKYFDNLVDYFAVSSPYEFFKVKRYTTKPILILDPIYDEKTIKKLIANSCELTISNLKSLNILVKIANENNFKIYIHLAINTGMNRFGFKSFSEFNKAVKIIKKTQNIVIKGVFSHYFLANNLKIDKIQQNRFNYYIGILKANFGDIFIHLCASDGTKVQNFGDMVRIGYGIYDDKFNSTITLKSKIIEIQNLEKGEFVGYGGKYIVEKKMRVAVVGIGYGDGLLRNLVKKGYVLINGKISKILAICMDCLIVDISKINCEIGTDVIIIGKSQENKISICDIAMWCDTIGYEIIVRLSERIKRKYIGENKCKLSQENIGQEN